MTYNEIPGAFTARGTTPKSRSDLARGFLFPDLINVQSLFEKCSDLLDKGLIRLASQITADIKAKLQGLGSRIEAIRSKQDLTVTPTIQNTELIQ